MQRYFYRLILLFLLLAGNCVAQTPAPVDPARQACMDFNAKIQGATDTLYTLASLWGTTFLNVYNGDQHYEELTQIRQDLQEFIEQALTEFKALDDVSGSQKLQSSTIALLEFEKGLMQNGFLPFEKLTPSSSDVEIDGCRDRLKEESSKEKSFLVNLNDDRREYTTRNGIPLVPPPPVKKAPAAKPQKPVAHSQAPVTTQKPAPAKPQPLISEPVDKKQAKNDDDDDADDKNDKSDKSDKEDKDEK